MKPGVGVESKLSYATRTVAQSTMLPEIALIDDSRFFLFSWTAKLRDHATVHVFLSPEAFWERARAEASLLPRLRVLVTDYRFDDSDDTGASFAVALRAQAPKLRIVLSSSAICLPSDADGIFDAVVEKADLEWPSLARIF